MEDKNLAGIPRETFAKLAQKLKPGMADEELNELLRSIEFDPTEEQLAFLKQLVSDSAELSDDELDCVSGGGCGGNDGCNCDHT